MFRSVRARHSESSAAGSALAAGKHRLGGRATAVWSAAVRRPVAFGLVLLLVATAAVVGVVTSTVLTSSAGATVPGSPGVPQAGTVLYTEGFENGTSNTQQLLATYVGTTGNMYEATDLYRSAVRCSFIITNGIGNSPTSFCSSGPTPKAITVASSRALATILGALNGRGVANHALVEMTAKDTPTPGSYMLFSTTPITLPSTLSSRFVTFSVNVSSICRDGGPGFVQPAFAFEATVPALVGLSGPIFPCSAVGGVGTITAPASVLFSGNQIGVRLLGLANGGLRGNDSAYDDIKVIDVTPQLDKAFSPTTVPVGGQSTLTWTITNTSELASKSGWSFTDTLPTGLVVAAPAGVTNNCGGSTSPSADGKSVSVTGNLAQGQASCTVSVRVTSGTAGSYTITVTNTGQLDYSAADPATFLDDLTKVLDDADYNADSVTVTIGTVSYSKPKLSWSGPLLVGQVAKITYAVTVHKPDLGDLQLINAVVTGVGGNCPTSSTSSDCSVTVPDIPPGGSDAETITGGLAYTGVSAGTQIVLAVVLFGLGLVFVVLARRRGRSKES